MAETVQIVIEADDQASSAIEEITKSAEELGRVTQEWDWGHASTGADDLGEAITGVGDAAGAAQPQVEGLEDDLDQLVKLQRAEALRDLGEAGKDAFSAMTQAAGEFVDLAAESEMVEARLEAQLKALGSTTDVTADQVNNLSTELSKLGYDDEELVQAETTLLRFGIASQETFDRATRAATDLAAATGQDLNSAFQAVGVALDTGNWGRLTRSIGDLTDAQKAALKAANDNGDAMTAQGIILDALNEKVGGTAETISTTWTKKLDIARIETDNFKQSIGDGLMGVLGELPQPVVNAGTLISDLGGTLATVAGPLANFVIIAKGMGGLGPILQGAGNAISGALSGAGATIAGAITLPVLALGAALIALILVWERFGAAATQSVKDIGGILGALPTLVSIKMGEAKAGFADFANSVKGYFSLVVSDGDYLNDWLTHFPKSIQPMMKAIGESVASLMDFSEAVKGYFALVISDGDYLNDWLTHFPESIRPAIQLAGQIISTLPDFWANLVPRFSAIGTQMMEALWNGIQSGWDWLASNVQGLIDNLSATVSNAVSSITGGVSNLTPSSNTSGSGVTNTGGPGSWIDKLFNFGSNTGGGLMPTNLAPITGGGGVTVNLNLTATAIADRNYAATQLVPMVKEALRRV